MEKFTVKIVDKTICVNAIFESTKKYFNDYLCNSEPEISIEITPSDIEFERDQAIIVDKREGEVEKVHTDCGLEIVAIQRKVTEILFDRDVLLFHGSVIAVDGVAYLFTAKSGTGKSTHTRLWRELLGERAVMVNDDKPFISVSEDGIVVHGSPWNGKHKLGNNISAPLRAICILERGEINEIKRIPPSAAVFMLIQQSSRPKGAEKMAKYMELLDAIAGKVKFYRLACNMEREAAEISFAKMSKED